MEPFCTYQIRYRYMDSDPEYHMCGEAGVQETSEGWRCQQHKITIKDKRKSPPEPDPAEGGWIQW